MKTGKHTITAVTRQDSKATFPEGVRVAKVDYDDDSSLADALTGQQFLVTTLGVTAKPDTQSKIISGAKKAGVPYIMPNGYSYPMDPDLSKVQPKVLDESRRLAALEIQQTGSSASWMFLSNGYWYEWSLALPQAFGFAIKDRKVTFFDDGKRVITTSTWPQCGRALASLLSLPSTSTSSSGPSLSDFKNKDIAVYSFNVSQRAMLDSLHRVLGTTDSDWTITYEPSEKRIRDGAEQLAQGDRSAFAKIIYGEIFQPSNPISDYAATQSTANKALGLPVDDLDEATKRVVDMVESGWNPWK